MITQTAATALKLGDTIELHGGGTRKITGLEVLPHVVRVRVGRSQRWTRSAPAATFPVVR